jgi:hypothetical protein
VAVVVNSQQGAVGTTAATTQAITPTGIVAGRSLVLLMGTAGGATGSMTGVADTGGNTWTAPDPPKGGITSVTNSFMACAYVHNCVAPGTITATFGSIANRKLLLLEISGLQNTPHDAAAEDVTAATSLTNVAPAVTMSVADFVIAFLARGGTAANPTSVTAGWTSSTAGLPDTTSPTLRAAWQEFGAAGSSGTCGFTFAATAQAGLGTIAFKVAAGAAAHLLGATGVGA